MTPAYDAVVLCGGSARRLGGVDKPGLVVGGRPMLDTVLLAVALASVRICVGAPRPVPVPAEWCREDPPGSGPVAGLTAALPLVSADVVILLAADLPLLTTAAVEALVASGPGTVAVDDGGREQWLLGCWSTGLLRAGVGSGAPRLGDVLQHMVTRRLQLPDRAWFDVDTDADRESLR